MNITYEYDPETEELINKLQEHISSITNLYESKLNPKTSRECLELARPGYKETIINEYKEAVKPYQKMLGEIYIASVPRLIVNSEAETDKIILVNAAGSVNCTDCVFCHKDGYCELKDEFNNPNEHGCSEGEELATDIPTVRMSVKDIKEMYKK